MKKMVKVPKDIQEVIKKLSDVTKVPIPELLKRLKEIMETEENIQAMENDNFKIRVALAVLRKEYSMGNAQECYFMPLLHFNPREIMIKGSPTLVTNCSGLVQKITRDEEGKVTTGDVSYGAGTFWRDAAKNSQTLEKGKVYRTSVILKENKWGFNINSDRAVFVPEDKVKMNFEEFYKKEIEPSAEIMNLEDIDLNTGDDTTDLRIIEFMLLQSDVDERDGREFGFYDIQDDTTIGENRRLFLDPRDVEFEMGSQLKAGVNVALQKAKDGTEIHRLDLQWILPVPNMAQKKIFDFKAPVIATDEEEAVDITSDEKKEESEENEDDVFEI
jgi:hypothetical protein